jgi:hypothetical protein
MAQNKFLKKNSGQAAITAVIFFVIISVIIGSGLASLGIRQMQSSRVLLKSVKAYAASESGLEDVVLRTVNGMNVDTSEILTVSGSVVETITQDVGGTKEINSVADKENIIRKTRIVLGQDINGIGVSFGFGAHVGDGGIILKNGSTVDGNVFSNGSMISENTGRVLGTIKVSGTNNKVKGGKIYGNAYAGICENSYITGDFHGLSKFSCTILGSNISENPPDPIPLPISEEDINSFKQFAESAGILGTQQINGAESLGPVKIDGNLIINNAGELTVTGTIWVTGYVTIENNAIVKLDPLYGSASGVLLSDGVINIRNNNFASGSGEEGSYLMFLSTSSANPAIDLKNNGAADIVYTNNGYIKLENNTKLHQVTGYGIVLENNSVVTYEDGLRDVDFVNSVGSEDPETFWSIESWRESP